MAKDKIIKLQINDADLHGYLVGFDLNDNGELEYRLEPLVKVLINLIPEFALGIKEDDSIDAGSMVETLRECACAIYKIDEFDKIHNLYIKENKELEDLEINNKYLRRGEFGELILHYILKNFHQTIPLISKIYFKDSRGSTVHGFDAVHIQENTKTLWVGESKLYKNGKNGVKELINDLKAHINSDYLNDEFTLISNKLDSSNSDLTGKQHWIDLLSNSTKLKDKLDNMKIALLCTYESENFIKYFDEKLEEFKKDYNKEIYELKEYFDFNNNHNLKSHIQVILLLFPIKSKKDLVTKLHKKLYILQNI